MIQTYRVFTDGSAIGNLAARCESACKELDASIVLSREVFDRLGPSEQSQLHVRPKVPLKGIGDVPLYTVENRFTLAHR